MDKVLTLILFVIVFFGSISSILSKNLDFCSLSTKPINIQVNYKVDQDYLQSKNLALQKERLILNADEVVPEYQILNLTIELEEVEHIYGYVGDYVDHWYQIDNNTYSIWQKANMQVSAQDRISLISTSCDCNEKYVDRGDEEVIIEVDELRKGANRFKVKIEVYEEYGKYAGNTAEYHFYYNITLSN